jgi:hypothetical protein
LNTIAAAIERCGFRTCTILDTRLGAYHSGLLQVTPAGLIAAAARLGGTSSQTEGAQHSDECIAEIFDATEFHLGCTQVSKIPNRRYKHSALNVYSAK